MASVDDPPEPLTFERQLLGALDAVDVHGSFASVGCVATPLRMSVDSFGDLKLPLSQKHVAALLNAIPTLRGQGERTYRDYDLCYGALGPAAVQLDGIEPATTHLARSVFGTLLVQLPVEGGHKGGDLLIKHRGKETTVHTAPASKGAGRASAKGSSRGAAGGADPDAAPTFDLPYAALYADCEQQLSKLTSGMRVVLMFNLVRTASLPVLPAAPEGSRAAAAAARLEAAVRAWESTPVADARAHLLALPLEHKYDSTTLSLRSLRGRDLARVQALLGCGPLEVRLALVKRHAIGDTANVVEPKRKRKYSDPAYEYGTHSFWNRVLPTAIMGVVYDEGTGLTTWIDPHGPDADTVATASRTHHYPGDGADRGNGAGVNDSLGALGLKGLEGHLGGLLLGRTELFDADPDRREYDNFAASMGPELNFWYHTALAVIWPRSRTPTLPCALGFGPGLGVLKQLLSGGSGSASGPSGAPLEAAAEGSAERSSGSGGVEGEGGGGPKAAAEVLEALLRQAEKPLRSPAGAADAGASGPVAPGPVELLELLQLLASPQARPLQEPLSPAAAVARVVRAVTAKLSSGSLTLTAATQPSRTSTRLGPATVDADVWVSSLAASASALSDPDFDAAAACFLDRILAHTTFPKPPVPAMLSLAALVLGPDQPRFASRADAFVNAVLARPDRGPLLKALAADGAVARAVAARQPQAVLLAMERLRQLEADTAGGWAAAQWRQPEAKLPSYPEVEAFLRGPHASLVYKPPVQGMPAARSAAAHITVSQAGGGFCASAEWSGSGREAQVLVTKGTALQAQAKQRWEANAVELAAVRSVLGLEAAPPSPPPAVRPASPQRTPQVALAAHQARVLAPTQPAVTPAPTPLAKALVAKAGAAAGGTKTAAPSARAPLGTMAPAPVVGIKRPAPAAAAWAAASSAAQSNTYPTASAVGEPGAAGAGTSAAPDQAVAVDALRQQTEASFQRLQALLQARALQEQQAQQAQHVALQQQAALQRALQEQAAALQFQRHQEALRQQALRALQEQAALQRALQQTTFQIQRQQEALQEQQRAQQRLEALQRQEMLRRQAPSKQEVQQEAPERQEAQQAQQPAPKKQQARQRAPLKEAYDRKTQEAVMRILLAEPYCHMSIEDIQAINQAHEGKR
ncbi:hypothetical protein HYH03_006291 [Edaphochlamys debaryana]|uniref:Uncharacterized protein n=1 Tax=Edaphochlamys debaryana TaxID=47281 RepID=A0A835Y487_9CHLO|nr:hypothetical protein HYH03_006291 [Edaphochlamys debaryana]|eukprot:KAG2495691.1 hypothetical protein HYH03_006291 [Edaphochlamys debaryana]